MPEREREIGRDFLIGLVCVAVLIGLKIWFGNSAPGKQLDLSAYNLIQQRLAGASAPENAVRVVNILDMTPVPSPTSRRGLTETPRPALRRLIKSIAAQRPAAIGIDVDFSPDPTDSDSDYVDPRDPFFFRFCAGQSMPIFLGVKRGLQRPARAWLGAEEFEPLAASLAGPPGGFREYLFSTQAATGDKPLPTLAARLAPYVTPKRGVIHWPEWLAENIGPDEPLDNNHLLSARMFSVDYSQLNPLIKEGGKKFLPSSAISAPSSGPCRPQEGPLCGKVVLIGDARSSDGVDQYNLFDRMVPGVYIHACATYTLSRLPLYKPTETGQILLDLLFSLPIIGGLTVLRVWAARRLARPLAVERMQTLVTLLAAAVVLLLGIGLVGWTRLLWDDFLLVVLALLLHPFAHRQIKALFSPSFQHWRDLPFEEDHETKDRETKDHEKEDHGEKEADRHA